MRRPSLLVVAVLLAAGCQKDPPQTLALASAAAVATGPAKPKFGDQTRPKIDLAPQMEAPRERTPEEWRTAFDKVCHEEGRCDKYLVSAEIQAAPEPMAKELTKRCWDARKGATARLKVFAADLAKQEQVGRLDTKLSAPGCLDASRSGDHPLGRLEKAYSSADPLTPERPEMRAALNAVGNCQRCDPDHVKRCDEAKKLVLDLMKAATAKQDQYCKDLLKPAGSSK